MKVKALFAGAGAAVAISGAVALFGLATDTPTLRSSDGAISNRTIPTLGGDPDTSDQIDPGLMGFDLFEWDTYLDIGGPASTDLPAAPNTGLSSDSPSLAGSFSTSQGSLFNLSQGNRKGTAASHAANRVFIGQFTVASAATISDNINLQFQGGPQAPDLAFSTPAPAPAPGSLALLGLAGLAGGGRRRRA